MERFVCPANNPRAEGLECAKTCQNYDLDCISHGCISGCLCPKGMVSRLLFVFLPSFFPTSRLLSAWKYVAVKYWLCQTVAVLKYVC